MSVIRRRQLVHSQRKGKRGELEVVAILKAHGWTDARRSSTGGRQIAGDIAGGPEAVHIEIKRKRSIDICTSLTQVWRDVHPFDLPLLVHRADNFPWLATLPQEDWGPLRDLYDGLVYRGVETKRISVCRAFTALKKVAPPSYLTVLEHKPSERHPWMVTVLFEDLLPILWSRERA